MFIHYGSIYKRLALSPADKRKKRELQLERKFQDVLDDEGGYDEDWTGEDLIDYIIDYVIERERELSSDESNIMDPQDLTEKQSYKVHELMDEHFWTVHTEEEIKKEAEQYVDPELDDRFTQAHKAYEKAVTSHGADGEIVKGLESELDSIEAEWNETVSDSGEAYDEARTALENDHWGQYYDEIINTNFKTESNVRQFLEARYVELMNLQSGGDVWRGVVMESGKDPTTNYALGRWWTDKKELARPFLKEMRKEKGWHDPMVVRYHARVDDLSQRVNLVASLEANAGAYVYEGYLTDRNEVQFFQYAPIYVYAAERLDTDPYSPDYGAKVVETFPIEAMRRC